MNPERRVWLKQETMRMRALKIAAAMLSLLLHPDLALAQEAAIAGAVTGAMTGTAIGGPLGGVIGAAAGAVIGGAAQANLRPSGTLGQPPGASPVIVERTCVHDAAGNQTCHEATR